ncbi:MAG: hypothetical protein HQL82_13495 [Magnetococcales bacterium]|nr:hypothetical protein [Magnetococcales bacterium]
MAPSPVLRRGTLLSATLVSLLAVFLGWRFLRPLNIFVVDDTFAWSIRTPVPEGLTSLRASECGQCHQEIYREWSQSIHARAWTEEYFQADYAFEGRPYVCINCHIQLRNQREFDAVSYRDADRLEPVLQRNPDFDPELQKEGVTCAVCHVREGRVIGLHPSDTAPHPVAVKPELLSGMDPCRMCHVASGQRWDMFYRLPPCGTVAEIRQGGKEPDCVGCHLPRVTRPSAEGGPLREGGRHLFQGGHHPPQVIKALEVAVERASLGDRERVTFTLTNVGTDHRLPTGTPDRHLTLELRLLAADGTVLDQDLHVMRRSVMWRPFIVDLWDTRLLPRQPRAFHFEFDPNRSPAPAALEAVVRYHLLDEARRRRIAYQNTAPIHYPVWQRRIPLTAAAGGNG